MRALTSLLEQTEPLVMSPDISMIPAPVSCVMSAPTTHRRFVSKAPAPTSRSSICWRRGPAIAYRARFGADGPTMTRLLTLASSEDAAGVRSSSYLPASYDHGRPVTTSRSRGEGVGDTGHQRIG